MITHHQKLNEHQTTFDLVMIIKIARLSISSLDTKVLPIVLITICKHYKLYVEFWDKGFWWGVVVHASNGAHYLQFKPSVAMTSLGTTCVQH